jgi:alkylated DNA repair protein alkB family protein 6
MVDKTHDFVSTSDIDFNFEIPASCNLKDNQLLSPVPSLRYVSGIVSKHVEKLLLTLIEQPNEIENNIWKTLRTRQLQCWDNPQIFPNYLKKLINLLVVNGIFTEQLPPNHVLINKYSICQGIAHHTDGPNYLENVAILSLGSPCLMTFRKRLLSHEIGVEYEGDLFSVLLQPQSLLVFSDTLYTDYMHGIISDVTYDTIGSQIQKNEQCNEIVDCINQTMCHVQEGDIVERGERISLTFRHWYS